MGIVDLFRPKYKHSDARVRTEAVRALTRDDADLLIQIARTDRDPNVRRIAIEKVDDPQVLASIARDDDDRAVRELATGRAAHIWTTNVCSGKHADAEACMTGLLALGDQRALVEVAARADRVDIRARAFAELRDARALAELARTAHHPDLRLEAVARISEADVLRGLALDTTLKEVGLAAVDRLTDASILDTICHKAKSKHVRQRARRKLTEIEEAQRASRPAASDEAKRRRAEHVQLVRQVEEVAESFDWDHSLATVQSAEATWAGLGTSADDDAALEERFQKSVKRYYQRRDVHFHTLEDARAAHDAEVRTKRAAGERAEAERAAEAERRTKAKAKTDAEAEPPDPAREARRKEAEARRADRDRRRAEDEAKKVQDAADRAARAKEDSERGQQIAASLSALVDEMEQLGATGDVRAIDRLLGQAAKAFEQAGKVPAALREPLLSRYGDVRARLVIQIKDLRDAEDWQRWANVPRQEALIKEALELAEAEVAPPDLGNKLKDLQGRWKQIGPVPQKRSKDLWDQFKAACDRVYEKVKHARDTEKEKWAQNAAAREQLISAAEALAESTDWETTAAELKTLQAQWKETGPLPRKQSDELWKRFRAACDRFFERRKPVLEAQRAELTQNLEDKQALCARAEAIVEAAPGEAGWGKAIGDIKALQQQWRDIGHVPRRDADAIYKRFRAACDALFAKRDAARDAEADARHAEIEGVRGEIEALLASPDGDDAVARALAVRGRLRELATQDITPSIELAGLVDRMLAAVIAAGPEAVQGTELDPEAMRARREKLVSRAEGFLPRAAPSLSGSESPQELAAKLKSAMASNALGGLRMDRDPAEAIDELRGEWQTIGPVVGDASEALAARFDQVCTQVLTAAGVDPSARRRERDGDEDGDDRGRRRRQRRENRRAQPPANLGEESLAAAAILEAGAELAPEIEPPREALAPEPEPEPLSAADPSAEATSRRPITDPGEAEDAEGGASRIDPPPPDIVDDVWDVDDHRPQAAPPEPAPPGAGEMAGDAATEGEGLDTGWD